VQQEKARKWRGKGKSINIGVKKCEGAEGVIGCRKQKK
jgi:hypothetical protein